VPLRSAQTIRNKIDPALAARPPHDLRAVLSSRSDALPAPATPFAAIAPDDRAGALRARRASARASTRRDPWNDDRAVTRDDCRDVSPRPPARAPPACARSVSWPTRVGRLLVRC